MTQQTDIFTENFKRLIAYEERKQKWTKRQGDDISINCPNCDSTEGKVLRTYGSLMSVKCVCCDQVEVNKKRE
jgi:hypothetical protein